MSLHISIDFHFSNSISFTIFEVCKLFIAKGIRRT